MGWWESRHGTTGDTPADILGKAFGDINEAYLAEGQRAVTLGELIDTIEFVSCGNLSCAANCPTTTTFPAAVR